MHDLKEGDLKPIETLGGKIDTVLAGELAGIPAEYQGSAFHRGAEIQIGKGRFKVANFGKKFILLEALPGTFVWGDRA